MPNSYNISWSFTDDDFLSGDFELFSNIIAIYNSDYDITNTDYNNLPEEGFNSRSDVDTFNVERRNIDDIWVSFSYNPGLPKPYSLVFISDVDNQKKIILSYKLSDYDFNYNFEQVYRFKLPYKYVGNNTDVKIYPNIRINSRKSVFAPIGEELVTIGEHHHLTAGFTNNGYGDITNTVERRLLKATVDQIPSLNTTSYVAGETGNYDTKVSNHAGYIVNKVNVNDFSAPSQTFSRIQTDFSSLANIFEEFVFDENNLQLLGHELTDINISDLNTDSNDGNGQPNFLATNDLRSSTGQSTRKLGVVFPKVFRDWLFEYNEVSASGSVTLTKPFSQIKALGNCTITFSKPSSICFVKNLSSSKITISIKYSSSTVTETVCPNYTCKIFISDSGSILTDKGDILERIYPVGSYYWSNNSTNPATLFGGTWEQIQGRFIRNAKSTDVLYDSSISKPVDIIGGVPAVKLNTNQIIQHFHTADHYHNWTNFYDNGNPDGGGLRDRYVWSNEGHGEGYWYWEYPCGSMIRATSNGEFHNDNANWTNEFGYFSVYSSYQNSFSSGSAGGTAYHNNLPPFLAAYCWRRIE